LARTVSFPFDALIYGNQKLVIQEMRAYDPNGVITETVLAGRQLQAGDDKGVILVSKVYADKLGFSGNYAGLVGKSVTLQTQPGYMGEGANVQPPAQCFPQSQQPSPQPPQGCNPRPQQPGPTLIPATVAGVTGGDNDQPVIDLSLAWADRLLTIQQYVPMAQQQQQ